MATQSTEEIPLSDSESTVHIGYAAYDAGNNFQEWCKSKNDDLERPLEMMEEEFIQLRIMKQVLLSNLKMTEEALRYAKMAQDGYEKMAQYGLLWCMKHKEEEVRLRERRMFEQRRIVKHPLIEPWGVVSEPDAHRPGSQPPPPASGQPVPMNGNDFMFNNLPYQPQTGYYEQVTPGQGPPPYPPPYPGYLPQVGVMGRPSPNKPHNMTKVCDGELQKLKKGDPKVSEICQNCGAEMEKYHRYHRCPKGHICCGHCETSTDEIRKCGQCSLTLERSRSSPDCKYCLIAVDHSNIYIGAKDHKRSNKTRINIREIKNLVCKRGKEKRETAKANAYVSVSANSSTGESNFSRHYKSCGFTLKSFLRASSSNKEKQIDCEIVADITEFVCGPIFPKEVIIAVWTGDADIIPGLRKALKRNCMVEIYSWRLRLSGKLLELQKEYPTLVEIVYLEDVEDRILLFC